MKVKVGDKVKILAGKDKGKEGRVVVTLKKKSTVVVEGINVAKKHMKPGRQNETGGILETENPIHVSNVKVIEAGVREKSPKKDAKKPAKKTKEKALKDVVKADKKVEPKISKIQARAQKSAIRTKKVGDK